MPPQNLQLWSSTWRNCLSLLRYFCSLTQPTNMCILCTRMTVCLILIQPDPCDICALDTVLINIPQDLAVNFVQISIEDITTRHGAHHELLNYELQRWELGRWVTVAKHGHRWARVERAWVWGDCESDLVTNTWLSFIVLFYHTGCIGSAGKNVGKNQVLDATGLKGMAEASHNWRIYFPRDAVAVKDRVHLGELVQLQVEINAKGWSRSSPTSVPDRGYTHQDFVVSYDILCWVCFSF